MSETRIKVGRVSFSKSSGNTYLSLIIPSDEDKRGYKIIGKVILFREYSINQGGRIKEVILVGE